MLPRFSYLANLRHFGAILAPVEFGQSVSGHSATRNAMLLRVFVASPLSQLTGRPMAWIQRTIKLPPQPRGFQPISQEVVAGLPELAEIRIGLLNLFLQHTSASLTINENADPDVPLDLESSLAAIAPEDFPHRHTCEGPDDMPAHVKSSLLGCGLTIPIRDGQLSLGTWQGIYLCEHRHRGGSRRIVATIWGE
jgi:secondary thiamine-phosphate synthase enzyme